jgi:hypothetical protein
MRAFFQMLPCIMPQKGSIKATKPKGRLLLPSLLHRQSAEITKRQGPYSKVAIERNEMTRLRPETSEQTASWHAPRLLPGQKYRPCNSRLGWRKTAGGPAGVRWVDDGRIGRERDGGRRCWFGGARGEVIRCTSRRVRPGVETAHMPHRAASFLVLSNY